MTVFAELDSMIQIPEEQPYGSLFSDILTEVDGMHPKVRQLIEKNARLNTDNVLLVESPEWLKPIYIQVMAEGL